MKLYNLNLSPFASRARLAIYAKSLPIQIAEPPQGTRSPEYLSINPMGKVPALVLDDGTMIPESETILEYLADAFPMSKLRPYKAEHAARARLVSRITDIQVMGVLGGLFSQMDPASRDAAVVDSTFEKIEQGLEHLNLFLTDEDYAVGSSLTTADCTIVPVMFFVVSLSPAFGKDDLLARHAKLSAYWTRVQKDPFVARVLGEMKVALGEFQKRMAAAPQPAAAH